MGIATVRTVAGAERFSALQAESMPQVDELCGCFQTHIALRLAGFEVDQEDVALRSGTAQSATRSKSVLPFDETGRDGRCDFPLVAEADAGSAPAGLMRAVSELSAGAVAAVPVAGPWTADSVRALMAIAADAGEHVTLVANVATTHWWGSRPAVAQVLGYLATGADDGPPPDWHVGHFVTFLGTLDGAVGTLVLVADTYPSLGWRGTYMQPVERAAAALRRESLPSDGGVLAILSAAGEERFRIALETQGFDLRPWDNGSPDMHAA
jgi:hypothetical protein